MNAHEHIALAQNELSVVDDDWRLAGKAIPSESIVAYCQAHATIALAKAAVALTLAIGEIADTLKEKL